MKYILLAPGALIGIIVADFLIGNHAQHLGGFIGAAIGYVIGDKIRPSND